MIVKRATKVADAVLRDVLMKLKRSKRVKFEATAELYIHPYVNGRESGWSVSLYEARGGFTPSVSFAENRNSDDIVVYDHRIDHGGHYQDETRKTTWDMRLNDLSYRARCFFKPGATNEAAEFVVLSLIKQRDESLKISDKRKAV